MHDTLRRHLPACLAPAFLLLLPAVAHAQPVTAYRLAYARPGATTVHVTITPSAPVDAPATLVIPRNYPGGYSRVPYDRFVEDVRATAPGGDGRIGVTKGEYGPRWDLGTAGQRVARVEYDVDLGRMEQELLEAVETSKVRPGYAGVLGYSVFGYIDGLERGPAELTVVAPDGWPAMTTLNPVLPAPRGTAAGRAPNFDVLADSQVLMGPDLQLRRLDGAIPLVLAVYAETDEDLALEGAIAREALDRVQQYLGDRPIRRVHRFAGAAPAARGPQLRLQPGARGQRHVQSRYQPRDDLHDHGGSEAGDAAQLRAPHGPQLGAEAGLRRRLLAVHLGSHSGNRHRVVQRRIREIRGDPGDRRRPPAAEGSAYRTRQLARLRGILDAAPPFIRRMPLLVLSREASYMYSEDFRFGMNVFARGSLMAADMDERIQKDTRGAKSLRDVLRFLVARTERLARPFEVDEFPGLIREATGVDVRAIFERWLQPPDRAFAEVAERRPPGDGGIDVQGQGRSFRERGAATARNVTRAVTESAIRARRTRLGVDGRGECAAESAAARGGSSLEQNPAGWSESLRCRSSKSPPCTRSGA